MRFFMDVSYHGGHFHGWQRQDNAHTVQAEIESALSTVLRNETAITGSGRTDTGVHASHQIAHFDMEPNRSPADLAFKLNSLLPPAVSINAIQPVHPNAHARFDASSRTYRYHIHHRKDPFRTDFSHYFRPQLDVTTIRKGCSILKETTDFESFSRVKTDVNHFDCDIFAVSWTETENGHLFEVRANRFLRGMVRAMVGTLLDLGQSKLSLADFDLILKKKDRRGAGAAVPAKGLFLTGVAYPDSIYQ